MLNKDIIIERLLEQNQILAEQNQFLKRRIAELEEKIARLEKNSFNSSRPPSSDIINPKPAPKHGRKRKRGGQRGHKKHSRESFTPDQIDKTIIHEIPKEQIEKQNLIELDQTESTLQQVELPEKLFSVIEHRVKLYKTPTGRIVRATIPKHIRKEGLFTSDTTAFVGYCKARCHMSYSTIAEFFKDIVGLQISESFIVKCCNKKLSNALIGAYSQVLEHVRNASIGR
jgi:transposase